MRFLGKKILKRPGKEHMIKKKRASEKGKKEQKTSNNLTHLDLTITIALNINELR